MKGKINTILIGAGSPSEDDVKKMFGWSAHKFGQVSNLPEGHLYKEEAPKFDWGDGDPYWDNVVSLMYLDGNLNDETGNIWSGMNESHWNWENFNPKFKTGLRRTARNGDPIICNRECNIGSDEDFTIELIWDGDKGSPSDYDWGIGTMGLDANISMGWNIAYYYYPTRRCFDMYMGDHFIRFPAPPPSGESYAFVRKNGETRLYRNGKEIPPGLGTNNFSLRGGEANTKSPLAIGDIDKRPNSNDALGAYNEIRVTIGIARYDSEYQVDSNKFPNHKVR